MRLNRLAPALLLLALSAFAEPTSPPANVVNLAASASAEAQYDILSLVLSTTMDGTSAQAVQNKLKSALDAALKVAQSSESGEDMAARTGNFSLSPRYDKDGRISSWVGSAELVLEGKDMARIGATAGKISSLTVSSSSFQMSRALQSRLESLVQGEAIASFKAKSKQIAQGFGFADYTLQQVSISASNARPGPRPMMAMKAVDMESARAPVPIEAGKGRVTVDVNGSIRLKN